MRRSHTHLEMLLLVGLYIMLLRNQPGRWWHARWLDKFG